MVQPIKILLFTFGLFYAFQTTAQQQMSLSECLEYALENSYKTKQARLDIENNEAVLKEKKSAAKPQVNADLSYQYAFSLPEQFLNGNFDGINDRTVATRVGQNNSIFVGAMVEQNVFSPALFAGLELVETSRELHQLLLSRAEEDIIFEVAEQYYGILKNEELRKVVAINYERLDGLIEILELQQDNDFIKKSDVQGVRIKKSELEATQSELEAGIATQKMALKLLMGMDLEADISVEDIKMPVPNQVDTTAPKIEQFTVMKLLDKQQKAEEQQRKINDLSRLPKVSAFGYLGLQFQDDDFAIGNNEPWNTNAYLGLRVEAPILDGGKRTAKSQQHAIKIQKIENDRNGAEQLADFEYKRTVAELETKQKSLEYKSEQVALLNDLYEQVLLQYKEQSSSLLELLNAEAELQQAQVEYSVQLFEFQQIALKLLKAQGRLKTLMK